MIDRQVLLQPLVDDTPVPTVRCINKYTTDIDSDVLKAYSQHPDQVRDTELQAN